MSADACVACSAELSTVRTTIRRADGTVRYLMCNDCFDQRFCRTCISYFPSAQECEEHRCPN